MNLPIYQKLFALYDNYEKKTTVAEDHTEQEHQEELDFLQYVLDSEVMKTTYAFLTEKGLFSGTYENFGEKLYTLWFGQYERATGVLSSSGFEHVFIGEVKNGEVSGYHNWFSLYNQEKGGHINYLGYWKHANIGNNEGHGLEFTFTWDNVQKPYGSTMIGTSPELELALYTTCLLTYPNEQCHVRLGGTDVFIQTWTQYYNGELMVGSSYPDFA
ncbi:poly(U)-specific endoribonuclease-A [Eurytemora carolleeae]|uniref:poly(U)-specific endoribonuclease-A n=1 Tax=Eurytemora carolleeae TaxID=1294199 RepID=UPI000C76E76A|nr:poly(U)-specific endoribonuclease-A [Eurytemora carolleeae]|eukprot:XP_023326728.1 poly(U)-specific endoribonuclease-A-like [Eurytemora affinis]